MTLLIPTFVATLLLFFAVAVVLRLSRAPITGGIAGLIAGFMFGLVAATTASASHYFGPVEIPDPVILLPWFATTLGSFYPIIFGTAGAVFGALIGARRKK